LVAALPQFDSLGNGVISGPACKWWEVALELVRGLPLEGLGVGRNLVGEVAAQVRGELAHHTVEVCPLWSRPRGDAGGYFLRDTGRGGKPTLPCRFFPTAIGVVLSIDHGVEFGEAGDTVFLLRLPRTLGTGACLGWVFHRVPPPGEFWDASDKRRWPWYSLIAVAVPISRALAMLRQLQPFSRSC
jgi:hypothetical protein